VCSPVFKFSYWIVEKSFVLVDEFRSPEESGIMLNRLRGKCICEFPIDNSEKCAVRGIHEKIRDTEIGVRKIEDTRFDDIAGKSQAEMKMGKIFLLLLFGIAAVARLWLTKTVLSKVIPSDIGPGIPAGLRGTARTIPYAVEFCHKILRFRRTSNRWRVLLIAVRFIDVEGTNFPKGMSLKAFPKFCQTF
jgi:hypothetical protein